MWPKKRGAQLTGMKSHGNQRLESYSSRPSASPKEETYCFSSVYLHYTIRAFAGVQWKVPYAFSPSLVQSVAKDYVVSYDVFWKTRRARIPIRQVGSALVYTRRRNDSSPRQEVSPIEGVFLGLPRENQYATGIASKRTVPILAYWFFPAPLMDWVQSLCNRIVVTRWWSTVYEGNAALHPKNGFKNAVIQAIFPFLLEKFFWGGGARGHCTKSSRGLLTTTLTAARMYRGRTIF